MSTTFYRSRTVPAAATRVFLAMALVFPLSLSAAEFYVSPSGRPGGNGSAQNPWDLRTALAHPAAVRPGDTIWLRGGTYPGSYESVLTGTSGAPIKVRQYPGERVTIQGNEPRDVATLTVRGLIPGTWASRSPIPPRVDHTCPGALPNPSATGC